MWRKISAVVIPTVLAVAIIAYMLVRVWDDLVVAVSHASPLALLAAVLLCTLAWWLRGGRYQYILQGLSVPVGVSFATACIFISQTANLIVPARLGDLVRMVILRHEKSATYSEGLSSLLIERIFDVVIIAALGAVTLPFVLNVPDWFITVIAVPIVGGVVFVLILATTGKIRSDHRVIRMLLTMLDQVREASLSYGALTVLSLSSLVIWLVDVAVCAVVAVMFQEPIPFPVIVLAIVIGNLVKAVPLTPGGVGTYELSLALTFELAGVAPAVATLIAVIDHLIKNLVTLAGGVISLYAFGDWAVEITRSVLARKFNTEELIEL
ncbi:MAG: flippase-like domain-containing protein [Methanomicrobiaceae archaeon]|nr:flippase-like domain-containing protein [Methanomicrobiaceae archaeon]